MVTKEEFQQFGRIVNAETSAGAYEANEMLLIDDPDNQGHPIEISWKAHHHPDDPHIAASYLVPGIGAQFSYEAPASEWAVSQTIDDHNLLTALKVTNVSVDDSVCETAVSVYGPPARHGAGLEIDVEDEDEYFFE
jgi:hypothetical protein